MRTAWVASVFLLWVPLGPALLAQDPSGEDQGAAQSAGADTPEITPAAAANQSPPASTPARPVATRQTAFAIPFCVDQTDAASQPVEVQLHVSTDQGKKWSLHIKERPESRKFNFRASGDGEYWFASRTIDSQNRAKPDGQVQPELKIVVDTQPPKFELTCEVENGEIKTAWNVFDQNLTPESLKLEYRAAASQTWLPIPREQSPETGQPGMLSGQQTWVAETTSPAIDIRGEVRDDAGNQTVLSRRVFVPRDARRTARKPAAPTSGGARNVPGTSAERPVEKFLSGLAGLTKGPLKNDDSTTPPDPFAARRGRHAPLDTSADSEVAPSSRPAIEAPPDYAPYGESANSATVPPSGIPAITASTGSKPGAAAQEWLPNQPQPENRAVGVERFPPAKSPTQPPVASRFVTNTVPEGASQRVEPPPGEKPSMTSARNFNLDYDTESVGPSGVSAVELWGTSDGGRTWTKWGLDADKKSPVRVDVDGDGLYGFCIVVESGIGLAGPRPHSGDPADIWVGVDTIEPKAQLTSAIFGTGEHVGQLDIRWEAQDENLKERPVTLSFAEQSSGPWTTIAAALPNNGRYLWNADPRLARLIYLRLEVHDEAGNLGEHQLTDPISTEGLSPKGRIRGIRPLDDDSQGAARGRIVR